MKFKIISVIGTVIVIAGLAVLLVGPKPNNKGVTQTSAVKAVNIVAGQPIHHTTPQDFAPLPIATGTGIHLPILMYHHIGYVPTGTVDSIRVGLTVSPQDFSAQVNYLKQNGYTSITLNDLYLFTEHKFTLPKKPVIFTFDDGYDDALQNAIPILKSAGYTGTFAIITDFPGTTLGNNSYATWDQILAAKNAGMEIVCHTQNHFDGSSPKFNGDYILQNLMGCQQTLQQHLGSTEPFLIYPYGHFSPTYLAQMSKLGLVMGLTVHEGSWIDPKNLLELPRVRVNPSEPMDKFVEKLND